VTSLAAPEADDRRRLARIEPLSVRIEQAEKGDIREIAAVLAIAFADDSIHWDLVARSRRRDIRLWRYFEVLLRATWNERIDVTIARRNDNRIVGVSVWQYMAVGQESEVPSLLPFAGGFLHALGVPNTLRSLVVARELGRHRPVEEHWYLPYVGVLPEVRRNRIGSALLGTKISTLDQAGIPGYLYSRSAADRKFFQNFGFGHGAVVGTLPTARPLAMFRPPARRRRK
jgi:GNAT superfamily N-acetyltransferase